MTFADRPVSASGNAMVGVHWVSPDWFRTMRVPLKRGRLFTDADRLGTARVVLINEEAARKHFAGEDPIGKRVAVYQGGFDKGAEIIGVVGDVRFGTIDSTARPDTYISYGQARISRMMIFVRTSGDPLLLASAVRNVVRAFAPLNPVYDIRPMSTRVATASAQARFSAVLLALFAGVALVLAMMGIYGVMAFGVAQRTREIGIRVALGADRGRVLALILREGALLAGAGVMIGSVAAVAFTRVLRTMLFEVTATDVPTYGTMILVLAVAVLLASWVPARRAASVDPVTALRGG
jgi:predicted permease